MSVLEVKPETQGLFRSHISTANLLKELKLEHRALAMVVVETSSGQ